MFVTEAFSLERQWFLAINAGDINQIRDLLTANPSLINSQNTYKKTALHYAIQKNFEVLQLLLKANNVKLSLDIQDLSGNTALYWAVWRGYIEQAKLLLKAGASYQIPNNTGMTPLHRAIEHTALELFDLVDTNQLSTIVNCDGETLLHYAVKKKNLECVRFLLNAGVSIDALDNQQNTAFDLAMKKKAKEACQILEEHALCNPPVNGHLVFRLCITQH